MLRHLYTTAVTEVRGDHQAIKDLLNRLRDNGTKEEIFKLDSAVRQHFEVEEAAMDIGLEEHAIPHTAIKGHKEAHKHIIAELDTLMEKAARNRAAIATVAAELGEILRRHTESFDTNLETAINQAASYR